MHTLRTPDVALWDHYRALRDFGRLVAALIGVGIYTALAASEEVRREYERSGLTDLCPLAPASQLAHRGRWASKAMPMVFGAIWLLAFVESLRA